MGKVRVGLSGWNYDAWKGAFHPDDVPRRRWLEYVGERFETVEINGSFHSLQRPSSYRSWYDATPGDFRFAVKGSRFITHDKRLRDVRGALANFLASGPLALREKLGPIPPAAGPGRLRLLRQRRPGAGARGCPRPGRPAGVGPPTGAVVRVMHGGVATHRSSEIRRSK